MDEVDWAARWLALKENMTGFTGFTKWMQGLLVGHSLATGEIWCTTDIETSRGVVQRVFAEAVESTMAMGFEQ